jgi:sigma-B regulation protein RsbU (phosphoserine phosphatase)
VGGDFYDFFFIDEDHFCVLIGDVSGKGVPAALFMAVTKTLIKSRASEETSTASIISRVNDEVSSDNASSMFVTIFIAIINIRSGDVTYTNAGHNPPYLKSEGELPERLDGRHGPVVGAMPDIEYREERRTLNAGDLLILYTDGITEAMNANLELFSEDRLVDLLGSTTIESAEDTMREAIRAVKIFEGETDQTDDITVLAFQFNGDAADRCR